MPYRSCRPYGSSLPRCRETRVPDLLACQKGFHRVRKPTLPLQFASGALPLPDPSTAASSSARTCALGRESSPTSLSSSPAEGMGIRLPTCSTGSSESAAPARLVHVSQQHEHRQADLRDDGDRFFLRHFFASCKQAPRSSSLGEERGESDLAELNGAGHQPASTEGNTPAARARDLGDQAVGVQPAQQAGDLAGLLFWLFGEREWSPSEL